MRRLAETALILVFAGLVAGVVSSPIWGNPWDDLRFPATAIFLGPTNPPSWVTWRDDGAGSPGVRALSFGDEGVAGNEEQVWGIAQRPHGWLEGQTDENAHIHWGLEDATDCNARFCLEHASASVGGAWPATTSTSCADCPSGASASVQAVCGLFSAGLDMSGHTISALTSFRLYRNSSHANDTCDGKAAVLQTTDIHVRLTRPGSRLQFSQ